MKKISGSTNIDRYIDDYKQANNILDDLDNHHFSADMTLPQKVAVLEKDLIRCAMAEHNNNKSRAAKSLGISRELLHYKINKYNI